MKKKKFGNEFKVGLFVIICIIGLAYLTFRTGKVDFRKKGYYIYAVFYDVAGLEKKSPVMLNGLEVGKVDDIDVAYENDKTKIILKLWLDDSAKIRGNPVVSIKTLGLMGEKYIQISATKGDSFVKPDAYLQGKPYHDMDEVIDEVHQLTSSVNKLVDENKDKISEMVTNLEATSQNLEELSDDLKRHPWKLLFRSKD